MISRPMGVIRAAVLDAIHAQHPILAAHEEHAQGAQFAQWMPNEQGHIVAVVAALNLDRLAIDIQASMQRADDAEANDVEGAAEWATLDLVAALDARQSDEPAEVDPFPTREAYAAPSEREGTVLCAHCGGIIARTPDPGTGKGWRHVGTQLLSCNPAEDSPELAQP